MKYEGEINQAIETRFLSPILSSYDESSAGLRKLPEALSLADPAALSGRIGSIR